MDSKIHYFQLKKYLNNLSLKQAYNIFHFLYKLNEILNINCMLSKNQIKLITSLKQKKYRQQYGFFVVEGVKTIKELLQSHLELHALYTTETFNIDAKDEILISETDLKHISFLKTPNKALAIFKIPESKPIEINELIVALRCC